MSLLAFLTFFILDYNYDDIAVLMRCTSDSYSQTIMKDQSIFKLHPPDLFHQNDFNNYLSSIYLDLAGIITRKRRNEVPVLCSQRDRMERNPANSACRGSNSRQFPVQFWSIVSPLNERRKFNCMKLPGNIILADSVTCPRTNEASSDDDDCDIDIWDKKLPAYIFRNWKQRYRRNGNNFQGGMRSVKYQNEDVISKMIMHISFRSKLWCWYVIKSYCYCILKEDGVTNLWYANKFAQNRHLIIMYLIRFHYRNYSSNLY